MKIVTSDLLCCGKPHNFKTRKLSAMIFSTTRIFLQRYFISRLFYIKGKLNKILPQVLRKKNSHQLLWNDCNKIKLRRCLKKCFAWLRLMLEELLYMLLVSDRELAWNFIFLAGYLCWTDTTWTTQAESAFYALGVVCPALGFLQLCLHKPGSKRAVVWVIAVFFFSLNEHRRWGRKLQ